MRERWKSWRIHVGTNSEKNSENLVLYKFMPFNQNQEYCQGTWAS